jgi:hypothetical protein
MTPRQVSGYVALATARRKRELADLLVVATLGARGEQKAIQARLQELTGK